MRIILAAIFVVPVALSLLAISPVFSQQQQQTLFEQALSAKLSQEINSSLACSTTLIATQRDLEAAKARIKELETATAPK